MITLQVQISVSPTPTGFAFDGRGFIAATDRLLQKTCGGRCVGVTNDDKITVEILGESRERLTSLVEAYCDHFRKQKRQVQIIVIENPKTTLNESELAVGTRLSTAPVKLTKAFFLKQAQGVFLVSNIMGRSMEPAFAEAIEDVEGRTAQWERVRAAGADQRACQVFPSQAHFKKWQQDALDYFRANAR